MLAPKELRDIHPLGKSPVISVERPEFSKPLVLAESGAIVEYLLDHFGGEEKGLVPKRYASEEDKTKGIETEEWLRYRFYMHYIEGSLMPQLVTALIIDGESSHVDLKRINCVGADCTHSRYPQVPCAVLRQTHHQHRSQQDSSQLA
jgi:glutathione S-transferase